MRYAPAGEAALPGLRNKQRLARSAHGRVPDDRLGPQRPAAAAWTGSSSFSIMTFVLRPAARCATSVGSGHLPRREKAGTAFGGRAPGRSAGAAARAAGGRLTRLDGAPRHDAAAPGRTGDLNPAGPGLR